MMWSDNDLGWETNDFSIIEQNLDVKLKKIQNFIECNSWLKNNNVNLDHIDKEKKIILKKKNFYQNQKFSRNFKPSSFRGSC